MNSCLAPEFMPPGFDGNTYIFNKGISINDVFRKV
jgi:hypothetical protein